MTRAEQTMAPFEQVLLRLEVKSGMLILSKADQVAMKENVVSNGKTLHAG